MTDINLDEIERPKHLHGFADGDYMNHCLVCKAQFTGAKRSLTCFQCAAKENEDHINALVARIRELESLVQE